MIREIRMREGGREGGEVGRKIGRQFYFSSIWRNTRAKRKKKESCQFYKKIKVAKSQVDN